MESKQIENIREMFQVLVRRLGLLQKEGSECCGVSLVQSHIIYLIKKNQGISLNALAEILGIDKSTMSRHIQSIIKDGYVTGRSSEEDKRVLELYLTDKGEDMYERIASSMHEYITCLFEQIPPDKVDQVIESLGILLEATGKSPTCCRSIL